MKENIVIKYRHTALSYLLSTLIPWAFWLAASYGTDSLRSRMNLFKTSMLFAAYWAVWHFHLAGIRGYYHANIAQEGWLYILNFIVSIFPFVILMNWLYYKTNRNILVTVIFHITAGYFNEIFSTHPNSKCIQNHAVACPLHHYRAKRSPLLYLTGHWYDSYSFTQKYLYYDSRRIQPIIHTLSLLIHI